MRCGGCVVSTDALMLLLTCIGWLPEGLPPKLYDLNLSHNTLNGMDNPAPFCRFTAFKWLTLVSDWACHGVSASHMFQRRHLCT